MKHLHAFMLLFAFVLGSTSATAQIPGIPSVRPVVTAVGERVDDSQTIEAQWTSENGVRHTVTTRIPPEADEEEMRRRLTRHARMVSLLQELYPPAN